MACFPHDCYVYAPGRLSYRSYYSIVRAEHPAALGREGVVGFGEAEHASAAPATGWRGPSIGQPPPRVGSRPAGQAQKACRTRAIRLVWRRTGSARCCHWLHPTPASCQSTTAPPRDLLMSGSTLVIAHVLVKEPNNSDVLGMAFEDLRMGRRGRARAYVLAENACWRSLNSGDATKRGAQCRNAVRTLAKVAYTSNVGAAAPEIDLSRNRACLTPHEADAA